MSGTPTIGRIVHYRLSEQDAARIAERRMEIGEQGNTAQPGDVYPATVVRVFGGLDNANLQVHLDGPDTLWVTSRAQTEARGDDTQPGCWFWPPRVDMTREGK